jgi:hypothetical protein
VSIWKQIEASLARFGGGERDEAELRALADLLPTSLDDVPLRKRAQLQELGAEALYLAGRCERVVTWSQPCLGPATSLWIGRALFDLDRPAAALPHLRAAIQRPLRQETRAKIDELILCCRIVCEPDAVEVDDFRGLKAAYDALGAEAPMAPALRRTIARRTAWPSLSSDLICAAQTMFGLQTITGRSTV